MCTGLEIAALASAALGTAGSFVNQRAQQANIRRAAEARNQELARITARNDKLADQSRGAFDERLSDVKADGAENDRAAATEQRTAEATAAIDSAPAVEPTLSGSAPAVVKSELAKRMADTIASSKDQAARTAKLGGFGDSWFSQGLADAQAGREVGHAAQAQAGNMSILPHLQDFAEMRAYKPISPLGTIMQGAGAIGAGYAGSKAGSAPWKPKPGSWAAANAGYL